MDPTERERGAEPFVPELVEEHLVAQALPLLARVAATIRRQLADQVPLDDLRSLGHFALTHIINDVTDTDANFVSDRWSNPLWRTYDWALLTLALFHGLNGLRVITDDYVRSPGKRAAVKSVLYIVSGTLFVYGTLTIVTF